MLELAPGAHQLSLAPHTRYRHDQSASDRPEDAWRHLAAGEFVPLPGGKTAFGFQRGAFWFHAPIVNRNADEPRWLLVQRYALSDRLDVFLKYSDGRIIQQSSGDSLPFSSRSIPYRHPNFTLTLPPGERVDVLVRVQSQSSMQVPLDLYTPSAFTALSRDSQFVMGLYYGILIALFVYNLVLWLTLRDASYFWYLFHISAFGLVLFTLNGFGFEYLWPNSPWLADKSVPLSICLALIGMQQFARTFLELPQRFRRGNWVSLGLIAFFVLLGIASLRLPYRLSTPIAALAVLFGVLWIAIVTIVVLRRGYAPAKLFLLAWAMFLLGTTMFTLIAFGIVPKNFVTEYGVQIGSATEMLLLTIALGYRYAALRNENERIVNEANQQGAQSRTTPQEVRSALMQLEDAHSRLRDSSRRDGLTACTTAPTSTKRSRSCCWRRTTTIAGVAADDRPGSLQADQRPLWPPGRRRLPAMGSAAHRPGAALLRILVAGALRRRGVRGRPAQSRFAHGGYRGRSGAQETDRGAVHLGAAPDPHLGEHRRAYGRSEQALRYRCRAPGRRSGPVQRQGHGRDCVRTSITAA